nr:YtpI family protein [Planococcus faecalis]
MVCCTCIDGVGKFCRLFWCQSTIRFSNVITYIISTIFIVLGLALVYYNYKAARHYHVFLEEEADLNP